jgi:hypothetical protein
MAERIVFTNPETGGLTIGVPAFNDLHLSKVWTHDQILEVFISQIVPDGVDYRTVDESDIPIKEDLPFRNAWMDTGASIGVDMPKARAIHLAEIRTVRDAELEKEDINILKAIEAGDTSEQSAVATKKQALRDIPATFDITTDVDTPEKLKAKWPTELPDRE